MGRKVLLVFLSYIVVPLAVQAAPRSHLGDIEAPNYGGFVGVDIDLDTGNVSLILDDGATGAGNLSMYYGQDTNLGWYRVGADTLGIEGGTALTLRLGLVEQASDAAVTGTSLIGPNAYSQAETNTAGGPLYLGGGIGTKEIKIVQLTAAGSTLTTVADGDSNTVTLVAGAPGANEIQCITSNAVCCAAVEVYYDANYPEFTATCDTVDEVYLDPATTTRDLSLTSADAAGTKFVVVDGAFGPVLFPSGIVTSTGTLPGWAFAADPDTGMGGFQPNRMALYTGGTRRWDITTTASTWDSSIANHVFRGTIYNSLGDLALGAACDSAGSTTNVCIGGPKLTVDNLLQLDGTATFAVPPVFAGYTRHHDVPIGAAIVGATAPGVETIGTFRCVVFDANADLAYINVEVPTEWNRTSNMAIDLLIFTDDGDALGNGEVIEFDLVYRSVDEGEAYDNGTAVTILANVTGGGAEVDKGQYKITATVDYDDTDQPLAINDTVGFSIMRDVTTGDTYSGDVHVCRAQLVYQANALATH